MKAIEHEGLKYAIQGLVNDRPLYASILLQMEWIADPGCGTLWTDGIRVGYDPEFLDTLEISEIKFCALHEGPGHVAHLHHVRRGDRDFQTWNDACDYAINPIFIADGFKMPEGCLYDRRFLGMDVESIFDVLWQEKLEQQQQGGDDGNSKQDDGESKPGDQRPQESASDGEGTEGDSSPDSSPADGNGQGGGDTQETQQDGSNQPQSPGTGEESGAPGEDGEGSGTPNKGECSTPPKTTPKAGRIGEVRDFPGKDGVPSESEKAGEAQKWITILEQANTLHEKACGSGLGYYRELIDSYRNPKLPWQQMIADWVTESLKSDYNFNSPNTRYSHTGFILPRLDSKELGHFVFILDSSSSVSNREASEMLSEYRAILETFRDATTTILHVDTRVAFHETYEGLQDLPDKLDVKGRGGTDFKPGFKWIEENLIDKGEEIAGVIYATDGECSSFPDEEPDYPVIWVITRMPHKKYWNEPPFGDVAYYED